MSYFVRSGTFSEMVVFCKNGTIFGYFRVVVSENLHSILGVSPLGISENKPSVAGAGSRRFFIPGKKVSYFFRSGTYSEMVVSVKMGPYLGVLG